MRKNRRLFKIVVPDDEWFSRYASNNEQSCPKIKQSQDQIMMLFENVSAGGNATGITVKVIIGKAANDEITFVLQVENSGPHDVTDI